MQNPLSDAYCREIFVVFHDCGKEIWSARHRFQTYQYIFGANEKSSADRFDKKAPDNAGAFLFLKEAERSVVLLERRAQDIAKRCT